MSLVQHQSSRSDLSQLIDLIESNDTNVADEAAVILRDLLNNGDAICLQCLLEKFVVNNSERVLDAICTIREPLDKMLLDKMTDLLRSSSQRCLSIFAQLILKQPTWLYKLSVHPFLGQFLKHLKSCDNVSFAVGGLFCISSLIPLFPSMSAHLSDYFTVFMTLLELLRVKSEWPQIYQIHMRIALFAFFQRLYALYPCNFLRFLRFYFAGGTNKSSPERNNLFEFYVRPMLSHVRLHPLFITSSKDEELAKERWMHKEAHDILVECNAICVNSGYVDAREATVRRPELLSFVSQSQSLTSSQKTTPMKEDRSSCSPVSLAHVSVPSENFTKSIESAEGKFSEMHVASERSDEWSPSVAVGLSTPPSSRSDTPSSLFETSSALRSNRTDSFGGVSNRNKKHPENKARKSFGQALGRFFNKPDTSRYKTNPPNSSVPPSPLFKDRTTTDNEFVYPTITSSSNYPRSVLPRDSSMELAEEASESELASGSRKPSETLTTVVAEMSKRISAEDSRHEDIEVAHLTKELSKELIANKLDEMVKSRHPSSQSTQSRNISRHSSFLDAPCAENDLGRNATFYLGSNVEGVAENEKISDLHFFVNNSSTDNASTPSAVPRLSNSHSVADFMKRINRYRFNSQCVVAAAAQSDSNAVVDEETFGGTILNKDNKVFVGEGQPSSKMKRPRSCPIKMEISVAESSINITPVVTSRRDSNQPTSGLNTSENQNSFTLNRSSIDEQPVTSENEGLLDFPLYNLAKMFYPATDDVKNKDVVDGSVVNNFEGFDDYLLQSRLSHDCDFIQKNDKTTSNKMELEHLRTMNVLLRHQLFYERHKKLLHAERNRRLHGRLKQSCALEEQNLAQKDQLRLQEIEIQQLIQALSDARRSNVEAKNDFVNKEAVLTNSLQKVSKEKNECATKLDSKLRELTSVLDKNRTLLKELGACKQHLFNVTSRLDEFVNENDKQQHLTTPTSLSSDLLTREALLVAEINSRLRSKLNLCQEYEATANFLQTKLKDYEKMSKKEISDFKKLYKKEKNRADASSAKIVEFENHVQKLHQQIGELKRQLAEAREVHQEHLKASQMKFRSLVSVCQRQEAHILELYQQLENFSVANTGFINSSRLLSGAYEPKTSTGDGQFSSSARGEGLRIPSREGAKEIMSYDSDIFAGCGSSCGSENMFLPFLFEKRTAQTAKTTSSVGDAEDEAIYAS